jgi:hypothetical protein
VFDISNISTASTRFISFPNSDDRLVGEINTVVLSNKTLGSTCTINGTINPTADNYYINSVKFYNYYVEFTSPGSFTGTSDTDLTLLNGDVTNNNMWRTVIPFKVAFDRIIVSLDSDATFASANTFTIKLYKPASNGTSYYTSVQTPTPTVTIDPSSVTSNSMSNYNTFTPITYNAGDMMSMRIAQSVSRGNEVIVKLCGYQVV